MRWLNRLVKLFVFLLVVYGISRFTIVFLDSLLLGERAPYFQQQGPHSMIVRWQTREHVMGVVRYGKDPDYLDQIILDESPRKIHALKLTRLQPDTRYYYKVGDIDGFIEGDYKSDWFHTAPEPGTTEPLRIWAIGDSGQPGQTQTAVRDAMYRWVEAHPLHNDRIVDVWLLLGDNAYRSGSNDQYQAGLFDAYPELLSKVAVWPVPGNHDARRWTYFKLFDLPEHGEVGGEPSGTENYYAFDYANVHFVMLDTQDSGLDPGDDMLQWLRRDLAKTKQQWIIAAFHHPPYTKGSHDSDSKRDSGARMVKVRQNLVPILEAGGVDLVLSGHSHMYERSALMDCHYGPSRSFSQNNVVSHGIEGKDHHYLKPALRMPHQGTVYVVDGSSSKVDRGELDHPANVVGLMQAGSVIIDVQGETLHLHFVNDKGESPDDFIIEKRAGYRSGYKGCGASGGDKAGAT